MPFCCLSMTGPQLSLTVAGLMFTAVKLVTGPSGTVEIKKLIKIIIL